MSFMGSLIDPDRCGKLHGESSGVSALGLKAALDRLKDTVNDLGHGSVVDVVHDCLNLAFNLLVDAEEEFVPNASVWLNHSGSAVQLGLSLLNRLVDHGGEFS